MKKSLDINVGDSKAKVQMIMGDPENRQTFSDREAWQYCDPNPLSNYGNEYVIVWLKSGIVYGVTSYKGSKFSEIEWSQPDKTIEVRER